MSTDQRNAFGGYSPGVSRTFWLEASDLNITKRWGFDVHKIKQTDAFAKSMVTTVAVSEKDEVRIIGTETVTTSFKCHISDDAKLTEDWEKISSEIGAFDTNRNEGEHVVYRRNLIAKQCEENTPTAHLLYSEADPDFGNKTDWFIEVKIPKGVLNSLENDICSGKIRKVVLGIKWVFGLVSDEYAPPSAKVAWGLTRNTYGRTEILHGHIVSINWSLSERDEAVVKNSGENNIQETCSRSDIVESNIAAIPASIQTLSNNLKVCTVVLVLLMIICLSFK